jgi:hypothetical protein
MIKFYYLALIFALLLQGCSTNQNRIEKKVAIDNKYDSELSNESISDGLEFVFSTVKKLNVVAFYMTYEFPPGAIVDKSKLTKGNVIIKAVATNMSSESVSGTVSVVYYRNLLVGMLTCNHIVDFPDTVINRYRSKAQGIRTLSVKVKQKNFVSGLPEGEEVKILAKDVDNDIAFLMQRVDMIGTNIKVLNYPLGKSRDLVWGSKVYITGFPLGNQMVTSAMVSKPRNSNASKFLMDAVFNKGISGSPVIAIRDGVPNFELVGMASSTSAKGIYYLKPADVEKYMQTNEPYVGDIVLAHERMINYGVTYAVSIDEIRRFLRANRGVFEEEGFNTDQFFK